MAQTTHQRNATVAVDDVMVGTRILYPHARRNGPPVDRPVTVSHVVEYPATRVFYFKEGGYGVVDRTRVGFSLMAPEAVAR